MRAVLKLVGQQVLLLLLLLLLRERVHVFCVLDVQWMLFLLQRGHRVESLHSLGERELLHDLRLPCRVLPFGTVRLCAKKNGTQQHSYHCWVHGVLQR